MSISSALSNAYSGLSAVSRNAEVISGNVANALSENYSRQETVLSNRMGGVSVARVVRMENAGVTATRREFEAEQASRQTEARAYAAISGRIGLPGESDALSSLFTGIEVSLVNLENAPDSVVLQERVVEAIQRTTDSFRKISDEISSVRLAADRNISRQVDAINLSLSRIEKLNNDIRALSVSDQALPRLFDERQALIDKVNTIVPVRVSYASNGDVSLFANGGVILLNGTSRELSFTPASSVLPEMSYAAGSLSGISVEGVALDVSGENGPLGGGSLAANMRVRDIIAPGMQQQIDALARDFIERFQNPAVDPTIAPGGAALVTDGGAVFNAANETGLSSRLEVNAMVDPVSGGDLWRIRDGLGAPGPGVSGDSSLISRLGAGFRELVSPQTGLDIDVAMSGEGFASEVSSIWIGRSALADERASYSTAGFEAARQTEIQITGVDTDREMQDLLVVEQAYAANAKVISVIDQLMQRLLEI